MKDCDANRGPADGRAAADLEPALYESRDVSEEDLVRRRDALVKMAALTGVATPSILAVLQSRRVLAASGGEE